MFQTYSRELIDNLIEKNHLIGLDYGTAADKSDAEELVGRIEDLSWY